MKLAHTRIFFIDIILIFCDKLFTSHGITGDKLRNLQYKQKKKEIEV